MSGPRIFNDGIRVLWASGGDPVFRDHTGAKAFISMPTLYRVRAALYRLAIAATGRERDALCVVWAEADVAYRDALAWRQQSRGIYLVQGDAA